MISKSPEDSICNSVGSNVGSKGGAPEGELKVGRVVGTMLVFAAKLPEAPSSMYEVKYSSDCSSTKDEKKELLAYEGNAVGYAVTDIIAEYASSTDW
jgi:hypothetical protein